MLLLSPTPWPRRLLDAVVALGAMVVGAGWWVLLTVLVPSGSRPYFGGSQTDSFIELTFSYNGLGRLTGNETGSVILGANEALGASRGGMWGETGLFRLWTSDFGDQITWLAPIAFAAIVLGLIAATPAKKGQVYFSRFYLGKRDCEVDLNTAKRIRRAQIVIFGAWLIVTWLVFSFMAGIFHAYYTVALSPAIAALVAIFGASLLALHDRPWMPGVAGFLIAVTSAWDMALILHSGSFAWLGICIGVIGVIAGLALCIIGFWMQDRLPATWPLTLKHGARGVATIGIVALLAGPIVWTACTISTGHTGSIVTAGPGGSMGGGPGGGGPGGNRAQDDADGTAADGSSSESVPGGGNGAMPDGGSGLLSAARPPTTARSELYSQNASRLPPGSSCFHGIAKRRELPAGKASLPSWQSMALTDRIPRPRSMSSKGPPRCPQARPLLHRKRRHGLAVWAARRCERLERCKQRSPNGSLKTTRPRPSATQPSTTCKSNRGLLAAVTKCAAKGQRLVRSRHLGYAKRSSVTPRTRPQAEAATPCDQARRHIR
ncbi:MAG: hypothetical protein ACLU7D_01140 [Collinsella sp.]